MTERSSFTSGDVPEPRGWQLVCVDQGVPLRFSLLVGKHMCEVGPANLERRLESGTDRLVHRGKVCSSQCSRRQSAIVVSGGAGACLRIQSAACSL